MFNSPSALDFHPPHPKSTTAVLFLKSEMRCNSSVMLNATQYIHFINNTYNCSILHFRYINVSNFVQSFFDIEKNLDVQFSHVVYCAQSSVHLH